MNPPETMTLDQAAEALQLPKATVMILCRRGTLPARKLGRTWRILRSALPALFATSGVVSAGKREGTS